VAVSWCGGRGVKKEPVLARQLGEFWEARAASPQLPAALCNRDVEIRMICPVSTGCRDQ